MTDTLDYGKFQKDFVIAMAVELDRFNHDQWYDMEFNDDNLPAIKEFLKILKRHRHIRDFIQHGKHRFVVYDCGNVKRELKRGMLFVVGTHRRAGGPANGVEYRFGFINKDRRNDYLCEGKNRLWPLPYPSAGEHFLS